LKFIAQGGPFLVEARPRPFYPPNPRRPLEAFPDAIGRALRRLDRRHRRRL